YVFHSLLGGADGYLRDRSGHPVAQTYRERMAAWALRLGIDSFRCAAVFATRSGRLGSDLVDWQLSHLLRHPADRAGLQTQRAGKPIGARGNAFGSTPVGIVT